MDRKCLECGAMNDEDMNTCSCGHSAEGRRKAVRHDPASARASAARPDSGRFFYPNIGGKMVGVVLFSFILAGGWKFLDLKPEGAEFPGLALFYLLSFLIMAAGLVGVAAPLYNIGGIKVTDKRIRKVVLSGLWWRSMRWADVAGMERSGDSLRDSLFTLRSKQGDCLVIAAMEVGAAHARQFAKLLLSYAARFGIPVTEAPHDADEDASDMLQTAQPEPLRGAEKPEAVVIATVSKQVHEPIRGTAGTGTFSKAASKETYSLVGIIVHILLLFVGAEMLFFTLTSDTSSGLLLVLGGFLILYTGYYLFSCFASPFVGERSVSIEVGQEAITYRRRGLFKKDWHIAYADIADVAYTTTVRIKRNYYSRITARNWSESRESTYEEVMARYTGGFTPKGWTIQDYREADPYDIPRYEYVCRLTSRDESEYTISSDEMAWDDFKKILSLIEGNVRAARGEQEAPADVRPLQPVEGSPAAAAVGEKEFVERGPGSVVAAPPDQAHEPPQGTVGTGTFTAKEEKWQLSLFGAIVSVILIIVGIRLMMYDPWDPSSIVFDLGASLVFFPAFFLYQWFKGLSAEKQTVSLDIGQNVVTYKRRGRSPRDWHVGYGDIARISYQWSESEDGSYEQVLARTDGRFDRLDGKAATEAGDAGPLDDISDEFLCRIISRNSNEYTISSDEFDWKDFLQIIALIEGNSRRYQKER